MPCLSSPNFEAPLDDDTNIHHFKSAFMCPRSIAAVPFDSVGILRTTLLLRTTCMRSCCKGASLKVQRIVFIVNEISIGDWFSPSLWLHPSPKYCELSVLPTRRECVWAFHVKLCAAARHSGYLYFHSILFFSNAPTYSLSVQLLFSQLALRRMQR